MNKHLLNLWQDYDDAAHIALQQLGILINKQPVLDGNEMKSWIKNYQSLYEKELLRFDIAYLDHERTTEDEIYVSEIKTLVDAAPFKSIIAFCKIQSLLLGKYYHLTQEEERQIENDYYYCKPNRNLDQDRKLIEQWLETCR